MARLAPRSRARGTNIAPDGARPRFRHTTVARPFCVAQPRRMTPDERLAACGLTREQLARRVTAERVAQGLPPRVEDRAALARMAALVVRHAEAPRRP